MANKVVSGGTALGKGVGDASLNDVVLVDYLAAYRRRVAGNYRSLPPEEIDRLPPGRMWVSPKIDGELWFLVSWSSEIFLANTKGRVIAGDIPVLSQAKSLPDRTVIAGELHARIEGRRARVGDLAASMAGGKQARTQDICFSAFDLLQEQGDPVTAAYDVKHARLVELLKPSANLSVIPIEVASAGAQVRSRFEASVLTGEAEGLIIRLDSGLIYKLKPSISIDAAIIAYTTKTDQPELVRSILLGLMRDDGRMQVLGGCGNLGSDESRKELLPRLEKLKTDAAVRYASESGSLYTFIKPEIVAEVQVSDFQSERSDGDVATSMLLGYSESGWASYGMRPSPRPLHPVLERLRSDKKVDETDVRISQLANFFQGGVTDAVIGEMLPASKVLRREVWTKETKGQIAVRKLLVWKTNKETIDSTFPAYVVHWTDYSASRASPLDREVRLAPDELGAMSIADAMVEENIKKGWNKEPSD